MIRFGRSMPGCSATDAFEIGRVPRCCPEFALIPNQVGSLSPSHAFSSNPQPTRRARSPHVHSIFRPLLRAPRVDCGFDDEIKWCGVRVMLPTGEVRRGYSSVRVFSELPPQFWPAKYPKRHERISRHFAPFAGHKNWSQGRDCRCQRPAKCAPRLLDALSRYAVEPARGRLMRPLPFLLATLQTETDGGSAEEGVRSHDPTTPHPPSAFPSQNSDTRRKI